MKKKQSKTSRRTKTVIAATIMTAPILSGPALMYAQKGKGDSTVTTRATSQHLYLKFSEKYIKWKEEFAIAGVGDGHTIYQKKSGDYFYIDPATGDMRALSDDIWIKMEGKAGYMKHKGWSSAARSSKGERKDMLQWYTIRGVDAKGNVVNENSRGELFTVSPTTGDMQVIIR